MKLTEEERIREVEKKYLSDFEITYKNFLHNCAIGKNNISSGNRSFMIGTNKTDDKVDEEHKIESGFSMEK